MTLTQKLLKEMAQEAQTTRKMLSVVPDDKFDWKPHARSMTIRQLATHIAELPGWVTMALTTDGLDFAANPYKQDEINNRAELLNYFEQKLNGGAETLSTAKDSDLEPIWTLRMGEKVLSDRPRADVIRMTYCQIVHHRAQLGVYLRLLDVPIPGSYGPSADEGFM